ncbi:MAG: HD domain-containing protein [Candidatus Nanosalina sp.]
MLDQKQVEKLRERLRQEFSDYYEKAGGKNYRLHHLESCRKHVLKLLRTDELSGREIDGEVAEAAALFHDIGRKQDIEDGRMDPFEGHEGHAERGAQIVKEYVQDVLGKEKAEKVRKIVGNHHSEAETLEGKIVQDVDLVTNYGVSDLWRMIHFSSDEERTMEEAFEYFWDTHVPRSLERLEELHFETSRRWARKRLLKHQEAVERMESEFNAEDISTF